MLTQEKLDKYADVLIWGMFAARDEAFLAGDIVQIRYDLPGRKLAEILFEKLLKHKLHPVQKINLSPCMEHSFFSLANEAQLDFLPPGEEEFVSNLNGSIAILAPESLTHLQDIKPDRIGQNVLAKKRLRDILDERENNGKFGWTLCLLPSPELAHNAGLSEKDYAEQIVKACYLDHPEPVSQWKEIFKKAEKLKQKLNQMAIESLHLKSENCDLTVTPGTDRQWIGVSGHNIPSFEIFTSPDWRGTQGTYFMDQPSFRNGNLIKNLYLEFKNGEVVKAKANQGENFVQEQLDLDNGSNKLGEFSLTDKRFSRIDKFMAHTLFDENFGGLYGNSHIALGASYAETYSHGGKMLSKEKKKELGLNDSALHWDLVNIEPKQVTARLASGEQKVIYENGLFVI